MPQVDRRTSGKRSRDQEEATKASAEEPSTKRLRAVDRLPDKVKTEEQPIFAENPQLQYWVENHQWSEEYKHGSTPVMGTTKFCVRRPALGRKRSSSSLASDTPDNQSRETKSAPYRNRNFETALQTEGGLFMKDHALGPSTASQELCRKLLQREASTPEGTIFQDGSFLAACQKFAGKNESRIVQDVARLLVPSVETLASLGEQRYDVFVENVSYGWDNCIPIIRPQPQPDYSVGFGRSAFSKAQFKRLEPAVGHPDYCTLFCASHDMYFPFFTAEVKSGEAGLTIADRQNANSMAIAVRGLVELFTAAGKERNYHRKILTFSVSHDDTQVKLYGYYPVFDDGEYAMHRRPIATFSFTSPDQLAKWRAYKFTVAVYEYGTQLLKDIRAAIDGLPADVTFAPPRIPGFNDDAESSAGTHGQSYERMPVPSDPAAEIVTQRTLITPETSQSQQAKKKKPQRKA